MCCPVNGSVCLVCCVFDSVCELFGEIIRNVMEILSVGRILCWIDRVWSSK